MGILGPTGNNASQCIRDLQSKGVSIIWAYFQTFLSFGVWDDFFNFSKKIKFWGILGPPYCGIGATIPIGQEMLCLPYAEFFSLLQMNRFVHKNTLIRESRMNDLVEIRILELNFSSACNSRKKCLLILKNSYACFLCLTNRQALVKKFSTAKRQHKCFIVLTSGLEIEFYPTLTLR